MPDTTRSPLLAHLEMLRRHWALSAFVVLSVLVAAGSFAVGLPDVYRASATILVEGPMFETLGADTAELDSRFQAIKFKKRLGPTKSVHSRQEWGWIRPLPRNSWLNTCQRSSTS